MKTVPELFDELMQLGLQINLSIDNPQVARQELIRRS